MSRFIDLSHTFVPEGMPLYPDDPEARLSRFNDFAPDGMVSHSVASGLHVGTHMDAPWHMVPGGKKIADFPVDRFTGPAHLIDAKGPGSVDADILEGHDIRPGDVVLVMFGWSDHYGKPEYYYDYPEVSDGFARALVSKGVKIVGFDTPSPDREPFPIHKILMPADILIIENLTNLASLTGSGTFRVHAFPIKFEAEASPVRVVAEVNN